MIRTQPISVLELLLLYQRMEIVKKCLFVYKTQNRSVMAILRFGNKQKGYFLRFRRFKGNFQYWGTENEGQSRKQLPSIMRRERCGIIRSRFSTISSHFIAICYKIYQINQVLRVNLPYCMLFQPNYYRSYSQKCKRGGKDAVLITQVFFRLSVSIYSLVGGCFFYYFKTFPLLSLNFCKSRIS